MSRMQLGQGFVELKLHDKLSGRLGGVASRMGRLGAQLGGLAKQFAKWGAISGGALGTAAIVTFGRFEQRMARVRAITGATGEEFAALRERAEELGRTTQFSASQAAEAMGNLAIAGFTTRELYDSMSDVLNLAAAGQLDMASASDIAAKIMRGMAIDATELTHATDVMAKAFTTSNTDLTMLGEAFKFIGPVAQTTGKSLEEITAAIQVLSNVGIQGAMAGTTLRGALSRLAGASGQNAKTLESLGIEFKNTAGAMLPLGQIVDNFNERLAGLGEAERLGILMRVFGQRAGPGMAELLNQGGDALREMEDRLRGAGGTAARIADVQMDTLFGAFTRLKSVTEGVLIAIGDQLQPLVRQIAEDFAGVTGALGRLSDFLAPLVAKMTGWWESFRETALGAINDVLDGTKTVGQALVETMGGWIAAAIRKLAEGVQIVFPILRDLAQDLGRAFVDFMIPEIKRALVDALPSFGDLAKGLGKTIFNVQTAGLRAGGALIDRFEGPSQPFGTPPQIDTLRRQSGASTGINQLDRMVMGIERMADRLDNPRPATAQYGQ